jgi:hypothetical protein
VSRILVENSVKPLMELDLLKRVEHVLQDQ